MKIRRLILPAVISFSLSLFCALSSFGVLNALEQDDRGVGVVTGEEPAYYAPLSILPAADEEDREKQAQITTAAETGIHLPAEAVMADSPFIDEERNEMAVATVNPTDVSVEEVTVVRLVKESDGSITKQNQTIYAIGQAREASVALGEISPVSKEK